MAGTWTSERFPNFASAIKKLTDQHRQLDDEPLHLAVTYMPPGRDQQDIYLFEVVGNLGKSENTDLFEATFDAPEDFNSPHRSLHIALTTPEEIQMAEHKKWSLLNQFLSAVKANDYAVLFADDKGTEIMQKLRTLAEAE